MARMNWSKIGARNLMARRGVESVRGDLPFGLPKPRGRFRRPPSKAELRANTAGLVEQYRGAVTSLPTIIDLKCPCGHHGKARLPQGNKQYRFRCRRCGSAQQWPPSPTASEAARGDTD